MSDFHFVYDRYHEDRFVPNGLPSRGPMWQRFLARQDEFATDYCRTPLLTLFDQEGTKYRESLLSDLIASDYFASASTSASTSGAAAHAQAHVQADRTPLYMIEMLYSYRVWLPLKTGEVFPLNPFDQISDQAIELLRAKRLKLVITHLKRPERNGYQWNFFKRLTDRITAKGIPLEQVHLIGCDEDFNEHFHATRKHFPEVGRVGGIYKICYFESGWMTYFKKYLAAQETYTPELFDEDLAENRERPHKFLAFNREPRAHRRVFLGWLAKTGIIKKGLVSFPKAEGPFQRYKFDEYGEGLTDIFKDPLLIQHGTSDFLKAQSKAPLTVDTDDLWNIHISHCTRRPFRDTYFCVLTERLYFSANGHALLTSKTFKSVCNMHPFIVIGPHRSLHYFQQMGYQTFSSWIDETYDLESDSDKRMHMVLGEIERLSNLPANEWQRITRAMRETLMHNYQNALIRNEATTAEFLKPRLRS